MVALIATFTVWTCLTMLGTAAQYERRRRTLGREVKALRKRYVFAGAVLETPDTIESDRKAA